MTLTTLVVGSRPADREKAIATAVAAQSGCVAHIAVILEGLPDGNSPFDELQQRTDIKLSLSRIAPGCPCCIGNLTMKVTLNRLLRLAPSHLYISLANSLHIDQVSAFLMQPPYQGWLVLTNDWHV
jgi:hypothetical protein